MVPVHRVKQLHCLLPRPVGGEEEELKWELQVECVEDGGRQVTPDDIPLPVADVYEVALNNGTTVEQVNEYELVHLPESCLGEFGLDEHPAEAGEGRGALQQQTSGQKVQTLQVVGHEASRYQCQGVVEE